ncbi:hypothetical protein LXA43DRAFT_1103450 [Ganoderma leucocontextum]|nr:hypothetical protein LXA43DRAFT_1103450 [Ganoderma leucocontextum]
MAFRTRFMVARQESQRTFKHARVLKSPGERLRRRTATVATAAPGHHPTWTHSDGRPYAPSECAWVDSTRRHVNTRRGRRAPTALRAVHNYYGHDLPSAPREDLCVWGKRRLLVTSAAGRVAVANTKATERIRTQTAERRQTVQHSAARLEPSPGMTTEESSEEKPWYGVQGGRDSARRRGRRAAHRMSNACSAKCKGSHPFFGQHPDELFARRDMAGASEVLPSRRAEV